MAGPVWYQMGTESQQHQHYEFHLERPTCILIKHVLLAKAHLDGFMEHYT